VYVGIDVSKARLDVHIDPGGQTLSVDNTPAGIQSLLKTLKPLNVKLVLIEGSGVPGSLNHLGVEVETRAEVADAQRRLAQMQN